MPSKPLAKYNAALRALAAAKNVDEVKKVRNDAEAIRAYAKQAKNRTLELDAAEIRLRAERRIGQMIADQRRKGRLAKGAARKGVGRKGKCGSSHNPHSTEITLAELDIDKHLANQARTLAELNNRDWEKLITNWRREADISGGRTLKTVLRAARRSAWEKRQAEPEPDQPPPDPRKEAGAYLALTNEDDSVPAEFETYRQKIEWLLRNNFSSSNLPASFDSVAKIVADAMWRIDALTEVREDWPFAKSKLCDILEKMQARILRIERELIKERVRTKSKEKEQNG
jgi:hypothetical protein